VIGSSEQANAYEEERNRRTNIPLARAREKEKI